MWYQIAWRTISPFRTNCTAIFNLFGFRVFWIDSSSKILDVRVVFNWFLRRSINCIDDRRWISFRIYMFGLRMTIARTRTRTHLSYKQFLNSTHSLFCFLPPRFDSFVLNLSPFVHSHAATEIRWFIMRLMIFLKGNGKTMVRAFG